MAGLLDGVFDPRQFSGLLGDMQRWQRSPEQAQQAFEQPTSSYQFGGQMVPVYGQAPQPMEVSAQSRMPQQMAQQPMPAPQMQQQPGMGDRMRAGLEGFVENAHTGPLGALMGGMMRATSGNSSNATENLLMTKGGLDRDTARAVIRNPQLMSAIAPQLFGARAETDDIKEYKFAQGQGFKGTFPEWQIQKRGGAGEFGMTPIWGVGPDGKPAVLQLGKTGSAVASKLPDGFQIARDPIKIEGPTGTSILDPQTRQQIGFIPKDVAGAEKLKVEGKGQGEASESLKSMTSKMPGLEKVVTELDDLSNKATYTVAGKVIDFGMRQAGLEPRDAAVARSRYTAMVDNQILPLLRDTFGAQFTEREGATLKQTLGDADKSPQEKQAVLKAFIQQKRRDIEALESRLSPASAPQGNNAQSDPLGLRR